jgi:hypothetical protein
MTNCQFLMPNEWATCLSATAVGMTGFRIPGLVFVSRSETPQDKSCET